MTRVITYAWRGPFTSAEVSALHAAAFGHPPRAVDWRPQVERHSLGWVCARDGVELAGFVNVAWDGGAHAFILDTAVTPGLRRQGIGAGLVALPSGCSCRPSPRRRAAGGPGATVTGTATPACWSRDC